MQKQLREEQDQQHKNFKIYKTILELLEARGYIIPQDKQIMSYEQFYAYEQQTTREREIFFMIDMIDMMDTEDNEKEKQNSIAVFYNFQKNKISQEFLKRMIKTAPNVRNFFLVVGTNDKAKVSIMDVDKKAISFVTELSRGDDPIRIELFKDEDLMFNILKHKLVPQHRILTKNQKLQLLKKYKVKDSQLPKILLHDPVARFLGLKKNQVVKIIRKSQTAGTYTTYRIAM